MRASSWRWCLSRPCVQPATAAAAAAALRVLRPQHCPNILRSSSSSSSSSSRLPNVTARRPRHLLTLAIETSCDDTCVAILEKLPSAGAGTGTGTGIGTGTATARLHFNEKITSDNRSFRGVHPLTAVVSHTANLAPLIQKALRALPRPPPASPPSTTEIDEEANKDGNDDDNDNNKGEKQEEAILWVDGQPRLKPDFVAVTRGPGMTSNLATGLNTAKGLAVAWGVPLVGVNHMQAHALTPRLVSALENENDRDKQGDGKKEVQQQQQQQQQREEVGEERRTNGEGGENDPAFPFLSLLVSGGHTLLVHSRSLTEHAILAQAMNIAIGDMLDKCARVVLPVEWLSSSSSSSPPSPGSTENVMYGALLEKFVFPDAAKSTNHDFDFDFDYEYTPPARRADEILPFNSDSGPHGSWSLTPPLSGTTAMAYDFAGFNSQVQRAVEDKPVMGIEERRLLGRHAMRLAFEHLVSRVLFALKSNSSNNNNNDNTIAKRNNTSNDDDDDDADNMNEKNEEEKEEEEEINTIVVSGGVASNRYLMHILRSMLAARGFGHLRVVAPPPALCTDNAAMVAWAGVEMYEAGWRSEMDILAMRKWPLDPAAEGGGILGAAGWKRREGME